MTVAADIVKIDAPSSAPAGQQVIVDVSVMNITGAIDGIGNDVYIAVTAVFDSTSIPFQFDYLLVAPFQTVVMRGWFTMPSKNVRVTAWSWYWDGSTWALDDTGYVDIAMAAPTLTGKIVDKWVNKAPEGNYLPMPASVKADGNTFEVGVSYRNDSPVNITGGVEVVVTKPDGYTKVMPAIDWSGIGIGQTLIKQYNIAAVDQVGNWTIVIRFLTQSMQVLDTFSGTCIISGAELVPVISEFKISDYIKV
jgi:hypothetical protein